MAEGRMIKRVIANSRRLANLKSDSARMLYVWMLPFLDVEGRFSADSLVIKGNIFSRIPSITPQKINGWLKDMQQNGLIIIYENDGDEFLQYRKFKEYQNLRADREAESKISPPPVELLEDSWRTPPEVILREVKLNKDIVEQKELDHLAEKIINYLNQKAECNFSPKSDSTKKFISGRLTEGRTYEDFCRVIDVKVKQWKNDPEWGRYLRPETLFNKTKFENYLNEPDLEKGGFHPPPPPPWEKENG